MSISSNLKKAVEEHNLADIRGCLWSCILVDPNMTTKFKESLEYVISKLSVSPLLNVNEHS